MKPSEINPTTSKLPIREKNDRMRALSEAEIKEIGDNHIATSFDTPMRADAFALSDAEKIETISTHFRAIMETLGLDLTDDSLNGTPLRVAKMYVNEVFGGLNPAKRPPVRSFENHYKYNEMLVEKDITFYSTCEHHFVAIWGKAHVAYIPNGSVVGLSKLNRLVQYYAARPQVQERLNVQIAQDLMKTLGTENVAVLIDANHMCVASRGVRDVASSTVTVQYHGEFRKPDVKAEFLRHVYQRDDD